MLLRIALGVFLFDLAAESRLEKSSQPPLKGSGRGERSGRPAGARQEDYFPEIYVPERPTGRVHGKLTQVRALIQFQLCVNFYFHVDLIKFSERKGSRHF